MLCECGCGQVTPIAKRNRSEIGHVKGQHVRFLPSHSHRWAAYDRAAVFHSRLAPPDESGCRAWLGRRDRKGYGRFEFLGRRNVAAYRVALMLVGREIPDGMQVDHLCRNRACCNPDHLDIVTPAVNSWRGSRRTITLHDSVAIYLAAGKQRDIANAFGVHQRSVWEIKQKRRAYQHTLAWQRILAGQVAA